LRIIEVFGLAATVKNNIGAGLTCTAENNTGMRAGLHSGEKYKFKG
jgi:hypothetical protein